VDYTHTQQSDAVTALGEKLSDPTHVQWPATECVVALNDALRMFNLLTGHDRARGSFSTAYRTVLYQLPIQLVDNNAVLLRAQTVTDTALATELRYQLAESAAATDQFSLAQLTLAIERTRDRFLADTAVSISEFSIPVTPSDSGIVTLDQSIVSVRRAVWIAANGRTSVLNLSDERLSLLLGRRPYTQSVPSAMSIVASSPLQLRLIPPPSAPGTLSLYATATGTALDRTGVTPTLLPIPDDCAWIVKYGAIRALLGDDTSFDAQRSTLCGQLFDLGTQTSLAMTTVLTAEIDGIPSTPAAIDQTDNVQWGWQGKQPQRPTLVSIAGPDAVVVSPVPDARPHSIALDVVRSMRITASASDHVQVAREHLEPIYALAQWLLYFKIGRSADAKAHLSMFLKGATSYASKRRSTSYAIDAMRSIAQKQLAERPIEVEHEEYEEQQQQVSGDETAAEHAATRRKA